MTIAIATPLWGGLASGIILFILLGLFHYVKMSVLVDTTKENAKNLVSELTSLQKHYENEIASIKQTSSGIIINMFKENIKNTNKILEKYHKIIPPARLALL